MRGRNSTERLVVDAEKPDPAEIERAAALLRRGEVVVIPTDTVYGLAADAFEGRAVKRVFEVKNRPPRQPLPILIADPGEITSVASRIPERAWRLIDRFWPGPLTIVLFKSSAVSDAVTAGLSTVGVRCPDSVVARAVIKAAGVPLATTSANLSGEEPPVDADGVIGQLAGRVPLVLDGGPCPVGVASTIIDLTVEPPRILREGSITKWELDEYLKS